MSTFRIGKIVMKHLFKKPATLMYPVVPREWQERTRGQISIVEKDCIVCGICAKKCPTNAITVERKDSTWSIERMQCIQCGCCVEVCPKKCLNMDNQYTEPGVEKIVDVVDVPKQEKKAAPKKDNDKKKNKKDADDKKKDKKDADDKKKDDKKADKKDEADSDEEGLK